MMTGEFAAIGAAVCWSCSTILYRNVSKQITPNNINLFKCVVTMLVYASVIVIFSIDFKVSMRDLIMIAISGVIGVAISDNGFFAALGRIGPQLTTSIQCLAPPFVTLFCWLFLNEVLEPSQLMGMVISSIAIAAVILRATRYQGSLAKNLATMPHPKLITGVLLAILSALTHAVGVVIVRDVGRDMDTAVNSILRIMAAFPFILIFSISSKEIKQFSSPKYSRKIFFTMIAASLIGAALGMYLMTYGIQNAPAGVAAALCATYPIWTAILNGFLTREKMDLVSFIFTLFACAGIVLMVNL